MDSPNLSARLKRAGDDDVFAAKTVGTSEVTHSVDEKTGWLLLVPDAGNTGNVYYRTGTTTVTTANGVPIPTSGIALDIRGGSTLRFIADAASQSVRIHEVVGAQS